jgi:hypothetical protein
MRVLYISMRYDCLDNSLHCVRRSQPKDQADKKEKCA